MLIIIIIIIIILNQNKQEKYLLNLLLTKTQNINKQTCIHEAKQNLHQKIFIQNMNKYRQKIKSHFLPKSMPNNRSKTIIIKNMKIVNKHVIVLPFSQHKQNSCMCVKQSKTKPRKE